MTNAPRQGQPDLFTQDLNRKLQSFRPSRAGLLLWCHIQGFARSAHPWLISSHPFGVEELRPIGGGIRYRIYGRVYLARGEAPLCTPGTRAYVTRAPRRA